MIRVPLPALDRAVLDDLAKWQNEIDRKRTHRTRRAHAKKLWAAKRSQTRFAPVIAALETTCLGARRCAYCEDSYAHEVEHVRPKHHYPRETFAWGNLLFACGACNGPKLDRWAYFDEVGGAFELATRETEPRAGRDVLIHPLREDPLALLWLDLATCFFVPVEGLSAEQQRRAEWTIEVVHLNDRDALVAARQSAFSMFHICLSQYVEKKVASSPQAELDRVRDEIRRFHHQTVWAEMKRQHALHDELKALFEAAPEALTWSPLPWRAP